MRATERDTTALTRVELANGLRVLLAPQPHGARVAVAVHYGVGFRSEEAGREGFAHLFEHLMFRGSENLPDGRFHDHVHRFGGQANGTTHQDYTDYYQVVPTSALEYALFSEADRMRAPRFTARALADQLAGVDAEIDHAINVRPYGGFPWPLLPAVLFRRFANAHDGYGDPARLRRVRVEDCHEFFADHYTPANAVLTVTGAFDVEHALVLVERYFADIPARQPLAAPDLDEPVPTVDNWVCCTEPGVRSAAVAIGQRLPDPAADLPGYLAHMVLAAMLNADQEGLCAESVNAACGFFAPLDAHDPDALIVTALAREGTDVERVPEAVRLRWERFAQDDITDTVRRVVRGMSTAHRREYADVQARSRALGRFELLFGSAEWLDQLPESLAEVSPQRVATAARELAAAPRGLLVLEPGSRRTRPPAPQAPRAQPASAPAFPETPPTREAGGPAAGPGSSPPVLPDLCPQPRPSYTDELDDTTLPNGLRVIALRDRRAPVVELRLRFSLGVGGWCAPDGAETLVRRLTAVAETRARALGGRLHLSTDGEWVDVGGYCPVDRVDDWIAVLARTLHGEESHGTGGTGLSPVPRTPERGADQVVRRRWLDDAGVPPPREGAAAADTEGLLSTLHSSVFRPGAGSLVGVGDIDPARLTDSVYRHLSSWMPEGRRDRADVVAVPRPAHPVPERADVVTVVTAAGVPDVRLLRCAREPIGGVDEPARYLATATVGGYFRSRLALRSLSRGAGGYQIFSGRDILAGQARAYIRAVLPRDRVGAALADIEQELDAVTARPIDATETAQAAEFCAAQLLSAFDSPSTLADMLSRTISSGHGPTWLGRLPDRLRATATDEVAHAAEQLFCTGSAMTVLLGDVDEDIHIRR